MQTIWTLGSLSRKTQFTYEGNCLNGVTIEFTGRPHISGRFFRAILERFSGSTIPGGFSMTDPTEGGLGEWVEKNSKKLNGVSLSPRHASFIAAILVYEGHITSFLKGNAVYLKFPISK